MMVEENKWDKLPNEILDQIIHYLGSEQDIKDRKKTEWMMVNKQWYDWYQSVKYKEVSFPLDLSNITLNNIIFSNFHPGKWVKTVIFQAIKAPANLQNPTFIGDPLCHLMTCCPNVKEVILPEKMDSRASCEPLWTYFSTALKSTNTWNLHSLSVKLPSHPIANSSAKVQYFDCVMHLRRSIRCLTLTQGMINGKYTCLQQLESLSTLNLVGAADNLADCCELVDNMPHLEEIRAYMTVYDDLVEPFLGGNPMQGVENTSSRTTHESTLAASIMSLTTTRGTTYPKIKNLCLYDYAISPTTYQDDMLHIKRFNRLISLYISFQNINTATDLLGRIMVDSAILAYIHETVPNYTIKFKTGQDNECQYLNLYCNGLQQVHQETSIKKFQLNISFCEGHDEEFDDGFEGIKVAFRKDTTKNDKDDSSETTTYGYIHFYISPAMDSFNTISAARTLLCHPNILITNIKLLFHTRWFEDDSDGSNEIGLYILGISNFKRCSKLSMDYGYFTNTLLEILHHDDDDLLGNNNHSIRHLQFEDSKIEKNIMSHISNRYHQLESIKFINCDFDNTPDEYPSYVTKIEVPNTRVEEICLQQDEDITTDEGGLVFDYDNTSTILLVSVASAEQEFEKGYICTSCSRGSLLEEVDKDLLDVILHATYNESVAFVKVKARYTKGLTIKIGRGVSKELLFDVNLAFPDQS